MKTKTIKVFMNGRCQAIRLPEDFRLDTDGVYLIRQGENIIISAKKPTWNDFFNQPSAFVDDFLEDRKDGLSQERLF